jgi:hypothetical protein
MLATFTMGRPAWGVAESDKLKRLGGGRYLTSAIEVRPALGSSSLRLSGPSNLGGHIIIVVGAPDSVRVEISKIVRVESEKAAVEVLQDIKVTARQEGSGVFSVDVVTPANAPWEGSEWGITLDLTIVVPPRWDIEIDARYFEYDLRGPFRDVKITTQHGRAKVQDVSRRVDVHGEYTGVELADIKGAIDVATTYANIDVRRVVSDPDHSVRLENSYGPISVTELVGSIVAETEYAPIRLDRISLIGMTTRLSGENVSVDADIAEFGNAKLEIQTSHSHIKVLVPSRLSARLNLSVGVGGTIRTRGLAIQTHEDLLGSGRLEGICGSGEGIIDIDASGPAVIDLRGK